MRIPRTPSGASASVSRFTAFLLCAAVVASSLLTAVTPSSYAQRRAAVRVATPAKSKGGNGSATRHRPKAAPPLAGATAARNLSAQDDGQEPLELLWTGEEGITETTSRIMARELKASRSKGAALRLMPEHEKPNRENLPQSPGAQAASQWPASEVSGVPTAGTEETAPAAPQTVSTQFDGATGPTETGAFPPDSMGAVGPTQYFVFINGRMRTFNKTTGVADGIINANPDTFFSSVMTSPLAGEVVFTSDPQVRYDRLSGRWFMIILDVVLNATTGATTRANRVLVAVSDAASSNALTAGTVWTFYQFTGDATRFTDYPSLGVDANALYIGGDEFTLAGSFSNTKAFIIPKTPLLTGASATVWVANNMITNLSTGDGPLEPRGVDNYDAANTGLTANGYIIGSSWAAFGRLIMRRVTNPGSTTTAPTVSANLVVNTPLTTSFPIPVAHLGNTGGNNGRIDALDDRLFAAHLRNGRLWTAHNIGTNNAGVATAADRSSARWYELSVASTGTPTVVQSGTVYDNAATNPRFYFIPSVMVSGQGHVALGSSIAGVAEHINAFTTGRLSGDANGTMRDGPGGAAILGYTNTTFAYNPAGDPGPPRRWGDYSFTSLDPLDDMTMWTIQEYCNGANTYGVRIAKLLAPPPAAPSSASNTVPIGQSSVNVTITGTSASGSGFYDPGANLASPALPFNHIAATVSGGVTVNSVTYTDPTHVTLNINTTGATPGVKNVTVTNPDGQSATGTGILTLTAPAPGQVVISEFRFRGPASTTDEFVELYNNTDAASDISGCTLWALTAAGAQTLVFTAPGAQLSGTTVIPARGHYLVTGAGYTLAAAAASNGALISDIPDGSGVGLFAGATPTVSNRIDSVGFDTRDTLFYEGTPLAPSSNTGAGGITTSGEYSFVRRLATGTPQDANDNASDFAFVSVTGGVFTGIQSSLGAPGPENLASAIQRNNSIKSTYVDPGCTGMAVDPATTTGCARERVSTPVTNGAFGTLAIRRKFTNNTAQPISSLRFRIVDITTLNSLGYTPGGTQADLRVLSSPTVAGVALNVGGTTTLSGLTLDATPAQSLGGGLNSTLSVGTITLAVPLSPGNSVDVSFLLGVQQTGNFRFFVNVEAAP